MDELQNMTEKLTSALSDIQERTGIDVSEAIRLTDGLEPLTRKAAITYELQGGLGESAKLHSEFAEILRAVAAKVGAADREPFIEMSNAWSLTADGLSAAAAADAVGSDDKPRSKTRQSGGQLIGRINRPSASLTARPTEPSEPRRGRTTASGSSNDFASGGRGLYGRGGRGPNVTES